MLGGNLRWTSISSRRNRHTPCPFILQKPEKSASTDEPSGLPNYDWGRLNCQKCLKTDDIGGSDFGLCYFKPDVWEKNIIAFTSSWVTSKLNTFKTFSKLLLLDGMCSCLVANYKVLGMLLVNCGWFHFV